MGWGHKRSPGLARFRGILGGLARHRRDPNEKMAVRTLNLAARELRITFEVLTATSAGEFEFAHRYRLEVRIGFSDPAQRAGGIPLE